MKMAILLAYENKSPFAGGIKSLINFAKGDTNFNLILFKVNKNILKYCYADPRIKNVYTFTSVKYLLHFLRNEGVDALFTDDYFRRLKLALKIKHTLGLKIIIYTQVYHTTCPRHRLNRFFSILSPIMRRFLASQLTDADLVVANSLSGIFLLTKYYGIKGNYYVYPPVDTSVFKPSKSEKENNVVLNLGSESCKDTDSKFVEKIIKICVSKSFSCKAIGNVKIAGILLKKFGSKYFEPIYGIPDEELAKIYSKSLLTICPQTWEPFGYVEAESILSGTPVVAFNCMGPREIIQNGITGFLANDKRGFLKILNKILESSQTLNSLNNIVQESASNTKIPFRMENSCQKLFRIARALG